MPTISTLGKRRQEDELVVQEHPQLCVTWGGIEHTKPELRLLFSISFFSSALFFLFLKGTGFEIETVFDWLPIKLCPDITTFYSVELLGFKIKQKPKPHANMRSSEAAWGTQCLSALLLPFLPCQGRPYKLEFLFPKAGHGNRTSLP